MIARYIAVFVTTGLMMGFVCAALEVKKDALVPFAPKRGTVKFLSFVALAVMFTGLWMWNIYLCAKNVPLPMIIWLTN